VVVGGGKGGKRMGKGKGGANFGWDILLRSKLQAAQGRDVAARNKRERETDWGERGTALDESKYAYSSTSIFGIGRSTALRRRSFSGA